VAERAIGKGRRVEPSRQCDGWCRVPFPRARAGAAFSVMGLSPDWSPVDVAGARDPGRTVHRSASWAAPPFFPWLFLRRPPVTRLVTRPQTTAPIYANLSECPSAAKPSLLLGIAPVLLGGPSGSPAACNICPRLFRLSGAGSRAQSGRVPPTHGDTDRLGNLQRWLNRAKVQGYLASVWALSLPSRAAAGACVFSHLGIWRERLPHQYSPLSHPALCSWPAMVFQRHFHETINTAGTVGRFPGRLRGWVWP